MKKLIFTGIALLFIGCSTQPTLQKNQETAMVNIVNFQENLTNEWNDPETTPLKEEEIDQFKGIHFFSIDLDYVILAQLKPIKNGKTIPFPTSAQKIKYYKEYAFLDFQLKGKKHTLTVFQPDPPIEGYEDNLFLPFMDDTNGETSYGGGRYIDLKTSDIQNKSIILDFNQAYNPYCAYSQHYNCPIPPMSNYLDTAIEAGVSFAP